MMNVKDHVLHTKHHKDCKHKNARIKAFLCLFDVNDFNISLNFIQDDNLFMLNI